MKCWPKQKRFMKTSKDKLRLLHIRDSVDAILEYSSDITYEDFVQVAKNYDAILMRIVVIGENVTELSDEFKEKYHDLSWYEAVGLRNRIAHGYDVLKPEVIWKTVQKDMPELKNKIEEILKNY